MQNIRKNMWRLYALLVAIVALVAVIAALYLYNKVKDLAPQIEIDKHEYTVEPTLTVLRGIDNTTRWVFLTTEDEEVVVRDHTFGRVAKIYPATYELGIDVTGRKWYEVEVVDSQRHVSITLPPVRILNSGGLDESRVRDVYGKSTNGDELVGMRREADKAMRRRAMSKDNVRQARANATRHFRQLFTSLNCTVDTIIWTKK